MTKIKMHSLITDNFTTKAAQEKFAKIGISHGIDLLLHFPLRYEDETHLYPIDSLSEGTIIQIEGIVIRNTVMYRPKRQLVLKIKDDSGSIFVRFINFYSSQIKTYAVGKRVRLLGEVRLGVFGAEMVHPKCRVVREGELLPDLLTPVYPTTAGLSQRTIRKLIQKILICSDWEHNLPEILPKEILKNYQLQGLKESVMFLHQPSPNTATQSLHERTHPAWQRIKFDELLAQQLSMRLHYQQRRSHAAPALPAKNKLTKALLESLSFSLTRAQKEAFSEISKDLSAAYPMQRLLQGDVGSGKTIVATLAALQAIENGYQVAIMVPTEILAEQHYQKLSGWLEPIFLSLGMTIVCLFGNQKKSQRKAALIAIAKGNAMLSIGTHALFQEQAEFNNLGLAIIDEQHRFGVNQRLALRAKSAKINLTPHQLAMSATPIPRTLAMSYYADLDVSVINELPPGRTQITTKLFSNTRREEVISRIKEACNEGKQAYWVCPLIEESETLQLRTALETYATLSLIFTNLRIGIVHGRLPSQEKLAVMELFRQGDIQLLIATTVIEVGVDVPNASIMVIEHAERMGLSQLHQLRGRIGRGIDASVCILLYQKPLSITAKERLKIIFENTNGFEIARHDLRLRGPGEFLGARQSGETMLRFADTERDENLLNNACDAAEKILCNDPDLAKNHIRRWLKGKGEYLQV